MLRVGRLCPIPCAQPSYKMALAWILYRLVTSIPRRKLVFRKKKKKERERERENLQATENLSQDFCDPMDCSLPGSSVHGIFQARILEWVAISFSRGSS